MAICKLGWFFLSMASGASFLRLKVRLPVQNDQRKQYFVTGVSAAEKSHFGQITCFWRDWCSNTVFYISFSGLGPDVCPTSTFSELATAFRCVLNDS